MVVPSSPVKLYVMDSWGTFRDATQPLHEAEVEDRVTVFDGPIGSSQEHVKSGVKCRNKLQKRSRSTTPVASGPVSVDHTSIFQTMH